MGAGTYHGSKGVVRDIRPDELMPCFMMLQNATGQLVRAGLTMGCGIMRRQCWGQLAEGTVGIETALQDEDYVDVHELEAGFPSTIGIDQWHSLPRTGKTRSMPDTSPVRTCSVLHRCNGHGEAGHGRAAGRPH